MRKSSRGYNSEDRAERVPTRSAELLSFEPTASQTRAKVQLWMRLRDDPSLDAQNITLAAAEQIVDAPNLKSWWADPSFRAWFLNRDEWRERVEQAFQMWADSTVQRLASQQLSDKDHIALGKLLAEVTDKMPRASKDQPRDALAGLTPAQQLEKFRQVALSLGYTPPAALPAAGDPEE